MSSKEKGQTLVEVLVALTVGIVVIGALAIATIVSLRNSQFSQNQLQATKLAQEGLDLVRSIRDRDSTISGTIITGSGASQITSQLQKFSDLWSVSLGTAGTTPCNSAFYGYFYLDTSNNSKLTATDCRTKEEIAPQKYFQRQILIEDDSLTSKKVTTKVFWKDNSGTHESNLQTILGKI